MNEQPRAPGALHREARKRVVIQPRIREPLPEGEIVIPGPPQPPTPPSKPNLWIAITTPLMTVSFAIFTLIRAPDQWYLALPMFLVAILVPGGQMMAYRSSLKTYHQEVAKRTARYRERLGECEGELAEVARQHRRILHQEQPPIESLLRLVDVREQLWGRRPLQDDFLAVRLGTTSYSITVTIKLPSMSSGEEDPLLAEAVALAQAYERVGNLPLTANLKKLATVGIAGADGRIDPIQLVYTLVANIAAHHSPQDVYLYILSHHPGAAQRWGWARWLPHTGALRDDRADSRLSFSPKTTEPILVSLSNELKWRADSAGDKAQIVLILDNVAEALRGPVAAMLLEANPTRNASVVFVGAPIPPDCRAVITLHEGGHLEYRETWGEKASSVALRGVAELTDPGQCEHLARSLAPLQVEDIGAKDLPTSVRLVELLDASQPDLVDLAALYDKHRIPQNILSFPIGLNKDHRHLDMVLREAGQGGYGSHAMLAGMTGTGKSVLLQSIVLSLAATHSPQEVNVLLADFKAGASELKKLQNLPHVVGFITDLDEGASERCRVAMESELKRRQQLMEQAGAAAKDIWSYNRQNPDKPLPHLIILLDEFAKALSLNSEFRGTMDTIAAQGRALGVHLFLSTQRATDFDERIRPNIDWRLSLRVANRQDSMTMLRRPEAAQIPASRPGRGFVQVGENEIFEEFQSARADTAFRVGDAASARVEAFKIYRVSPDGRREKPELVHFKGGSMAGLDTTQGEEALSEAEILVQHIIDFCQDAGYAPAHKIYWPELPEDLPLFALLESENISVFRRWDDTGWWASLGDPFARLKVPLGMVDLPAQQRQDIWSIDFTGGDGHFWVVGSPGSGKSLFLRTLVLSMAAAHSPDDLHMYFLDFGQRVFQTFSSLPHCGGVFLPAEGERVTRLLALLGQEVIRRQEVMAAVLADDPNDFRVRQPDQPMPTLMIVCDNFAEFRNTFQENLLTIDHLTRTGKAVDIHLVISTDRSADLPMSIRSNIANRLALRVTPDDYIEILGKRITALPKVPGRGHIVLNGEIVECQVASPIADPNAPHQDQLQELVQSMDASWGDNPRPLEVYMLPTHIELGSLLDAVPIRGEWDSALPTGPIGRAYDDLSVITLDLNSFGPFGLVIGPSGCGKTEFLVTLCLSTLAAANPKEVEISILDLKRTNLRLLRDLPGVTYASERNAEEMLSQLVATLEKRAAEYQEAHARDTQHMSLSEIFKVLPLSLLIVDDLQSLTLPACQSLLDMVNRCASLRRQGRLSMLIAGTGDDVRRAKISQACIQEALRDRTGVNFSTDPGELDYLGVQLPADVRRLHTPLCKGRGFLVEQGQWLAAQFATVEPVDGEGDKEAYRASFQRIADIIQRKI